MIVTIPEIIARLQEEKKTCVLSLQIENEQSLVKFYFDRGVICQVSWGGRKNEACFPLLCTAKYRKYSFSEDVSLHIPEASAAAQKILEQIMTIERVAGGVNSAYGQSIKAAFLEPEAVQKVETALTDAVGPVAAVLLDDCLKLIGYPKGSRLSKEALKLIVRMLAREIPESDRTRFVGKCAS